MAKEGIHWLARSMRGSAALCGLGLVIAYDGVVPALEADAPGLSFLACYNGLVFLGMLGICLFPRKAGRLCDSKAVLATACCAGCAAVLVQASVVSFGTFLPQAVHILCTAGSATLAAAFWCTAEFKFLNALVGRGIVASIVVMTVSHAIASSLSLVCALLPLVPSATIVAAAASLACLPLLSRQTGSPDHASSQALLDSPDASRTQLPVRPALLMVLVVIVVFFVRERISNSAAISSYAGVLVTAVAVLAVMVLNGRTVRFRFLYDASMLLGLLGLFLFTQGGVAVHVLAAACANGAYALLDIFTVALLCSICATYQLDSYRLFGFLLIGTHAGSLAAAASYPLVAGFGEPAMTSLAFALAILVACAYTFLLTENDYRTSWGTVKEDEESRVARFYRSLPESCAHMAHRFGLTRREEDVLLLLAQRKSDSEIASELFVSVSTVKSHCKSIYRKLDVHKRDQVAELLGYPFGKADDE